MKWKCYLCAKVYHYYESMKKSLILYLFIFCSLCRVQGQTEVCLVGTKHEPCAYFNSDSVYAILLRVQPDVVLMELDSSFFDKNFRFDLEKYPDLLSTNENIGAHRYQQEQGVDLRPFEITGRNEWYREHRYFERQDSMWRDVMSLYRADKLSRKNWEDMELILQVMNYNDMKFASPRDMNSSMTMGYLSLREYILYQKLVSIVETEELLSRWRSFVRLWSSRWYERNVVMAANIRRMAKLYPGKRLLVLVGLEHKPGLLKLLKECEGVELKEYWEF